MTRRRFTVVGAVFGLLGTVALIWGFVLDRRQAAYAYLFAFAALFSLLVGMLYLLLIGHATNARWFVPLRRQCEIVLGAFPLVALLLAPVLIFMDALYPWLDVHALPPLVQHHVEKKLAWLDRSFFVWRAILYMVLLLGLTELLRRWSLEQDGSQSQLHARRLRDRMVKWSVAGLLVASLALTFASWDWIMSIEPAWYSNLYGVYIFAGGFLAALGLLGMMLVVGGRIGWLPREISSQHYHAVGRLQLAFVIFWTYIGWCHVLQQWIANIPVEQLWHLRRWYGGWQWLGLALIIVHFVIPFFALLSRAVKKNAASFFAISSWLVVVHLVDVYYLVVPALHEQNVGLGWMNVAAVVALIGWAVAFSAMRTREVRAVPVGDPLLARGLRYESQS